MVILHWTPQAFDDLESIFQYISRDSRPTARLFVEKIFYRVDQLRHFPQSGRAVPEIERKDIRELIYKNYRIVYQSVNNEHIRILTIFHASKNLNDTKLP